MIRRLGWSEPLDQRPPNGVQYTKHIWYTPYLLDISLVQYSAVAIDTLIFGESRQCIYCIPLVDYSQP